MPTWLKIVLAILAVLITLLGAAGFLVVRAFDQGRREAERARIEGQVHGEYGSLEGCLEEGVRRTGSCEGNVAACIFVIDAFYWSCLEAAPYDADFCADVPAAGDDKATKKWSNATCARYGMPDHELCRFNISVVAPFCASRG